VIGCRFLGEADVGPPRSATELPNRRLGMKLLEPFRRGSSARESPIPLQGIGDEPKRDGVGIG